MLIIILHQNVTSSDGTYVPSHLDLLMEIYHLIHPMFMLCIITTTGNNGNVQLIGGGSVNEEY